LTVGRTVFIGDIQGCRTELEALLRELQFDPAEDALHPVGDLVNRGPDSVGTLRLLRRLGARPVLGNHDLHLLRVAAGTRRLREGDTFSDVLEAPDRDELLAWLRGLPFARALDGVLLVHAGVHPLWKDPVARLAGIDPCVRHPDTDFVTRVRLCDREGRRPEEPSADEHGRFEPWFDFLPPRPDRTVVFGHWAQQGLLVRPGLRGLDTGCVWGHELTAWIREEDRLVGVPAERVYCPLE
jgi:bis(5'-nucleosyl)-tetraphosphatase (symmetrical)